MSEQNRTILKTFFDVGAIPNEEEFADLIDSAINKIDDEITVDTGKNIGIGTATPTEKLSVEGNISVSGTVDGRDLATDGVKLDELYTTNGLANLKLDQVEELIRIGSSEFAQLEWSHLSEVDQPLKTTASVAFKDLTTGEVKALDDQGLKLSDQSGAGLFVADGGHIGLGIAVPTEKLSVEGNISVSGTVDGRDLAADGVKLDELYTTNGLANLKLDQVEELIRIGSSEFAQLEWSHLSEVDQPLKTTASVAFKDLRTGEVKAPDEQGLKLSDQSGAGLFVADGGKVGIGTVEPAASLDVRGNISLAGPVQLGADDQDTVTVYGPLLSQHSSDALVIADDLNLNGNAVLAGTLQVTGNTQVQTFNAAAQATLAALDVTNHSALKTLAVAGEATMAEDLILQGNLRLGGDIIASEIEESLDGLQKIVNFIKQNRSTLDTAVTDIDGLTTDVNRIDSLIGTDALPALVTETQAKEGTSHIARLWSELRIQQAIEARAPAQAVPILQTISVKEFTEEIIIDFSALDDYQEHLGFRLLISNLETDTDNAALNLTIKTQETFNTESVYDWNTLVRRPNTTTQYQSHAVGGASAQLIHNASNAGLSLGSDQAANLELSIFGLTGDYCKIKADGVYVDSSNLAVRMESHMIVRDNRPVQAIRLSPNSGKIKGEFRLFAIGTKTPVVPEIPNLMPRMPAMPRLPASTTEPFVLGYTP